MTCFRLLFSSVFCLLFCLSALVCGQTPAPETPPKLLSVTETNVGALNEFVLDGTMSCVQIRKGSSTVRPIIGAVTNASNYINRIAPGGIGVIWGERFSETGEMYTADRLPLSRKLGRVQVLWRAADWYSMIDGWQEDCGWRAAPLFFVGPNQINFQVPMFYYKPFSEEEGDGYSRFSNFEGRDYEFIVLQVLPDGVTKVSSNTFKLKINSHAPEFFPQAFFKYPEYQAVATIAPNQVFVAYLSGLGKISDHEPEGYPAPVPPWLTSFPTVVEYRNQFGTRILRTGYSFAGRAPGLVGLDQLNFSVPNLPLATGDPVSIYLCTGTDNADRCSERGMNFIYRP